MVYSKYSGNACITEVLQQCLCLELRQELRFQMCFFTHCHHEHEYIQLIGRDLHPLPAIFRDKIRLSLHIHMDGCLCGVGYITLDSAHPFSIQCLKTYLFSTGLAHTTGHLTGSWYKLPATHWNISLPH